MWLLVIGGVLLGWSLNMIDSKDDQTMQCKQVYEQGYEDGNNEH